MFKTYFDNQQLYLLSVGALLVISSIVFQLRNQYKQALIILFIGTIGIYLFSALLDPFLNLWDERFHALVAKNLLSHPLRPTLYDDPVVNMAYNHWDNAIIWLHKQPLFLWQIALSFKLFGVSEFTLRLPSAILSSFLILFSYRTGKLLISKRVGFYTAFLFSTSFYMIELISGRQDVDHNDIAFLFYVSASIWAWSEYIVSGKKYWIILIGVFSGGAVICKWLTGLLVYSGWLIYSVLSNKTEIKRYKDIIFSFIIALIIILPWQIFTFIKYPADALYEFNYNSMHFTRVMEGHAGSVWFHFNNIGTMYGKLVLYLLLPGLILLYLKIKNKFIAVSFVSFPIIIYLFYTLAKTKMQSYPIVVAMPVFMSLACIIDFVFSKIELIRIPKIIISVVLFLIIVFTGFMNLDINKIQEKHTLWKTDNQYTRMLAHNKEIFLTLNDSLPGNSVIFNVKGRHYVEAMFYTGFPAYNFIPTEAQYKDVRSKGKTIVIFETSDSQMPDYITNNKNSIILQQQLQGFE
ncbi:MAG: glycosyltransferase family 39 protein [Bacteroidales bacterium]|jgi:4-amino-4-deoxy-L-arabinose transferase